MALLSGVRVMITRAADQADALHQSLAALGAEVMVFPTIATRVCDDPDGWQQFAAGRQSGGWLLFTSENGVRYFFEQLARHNEVLQDLSRFKIAVVGESTADSLHRHGRSADYMPSRATGEEFAREFVTHTNLGGTTFVRVRGNLADDRLDRALTQAGGVVIPLTVYETYHPVWTAEMKQRLSLAPPDLVIFASGSAVEGLFANLTADEIHRILSPGLLVSIGPSTSAVMRRRGLEVGLEARRHTIPDLIDELAVYAAENPIRRKP